MRIHRSTSALCARCWLGGEFLLFVEGGVRKFFCQIVAYGVVCEPLSIKRNKNYDTFITKMRITPVLTKMLFWSTVVL